ncbi:MAG: addiction module protein [Spiribacter salinus]|uniref:Addiction module protein n=1 Tax=Spiribacter salinus TaxID=1335746 RepID=A0A540VTS9_9GAMM|nr:MAG: addiction module protein [Spiribacter salinus]
MSLPLDEMSTEDKLRAMEEPWVDRSGTPEQIPSPEWHGDVLADRKARFRRVEVEPTDWSKAKQGLRDRTSED